MNSQEFYAKLVDRTCGLTTESCKSFVQELKLRGWFNGSVAIKEFHLSSMFSETGRFFIKFTVGDDGTLRYSEYVFDFMSERMAKIGDL